MIELLTGELPAWVAWAGTYLIHALIWLGVGWVATRPALGLAAKTQNVVWRAALVVPVFLASLHTAGVGTRDLPRWQISLLTSPGAPVAGEGEPALLSPFDRVELDDAVFRPIVIADDAEAASPKREPGGAFPALPALATLFVAVFVAIALARLYRLGLVGARLYQRLRGRRPVLDERAHRLLAELVPQTRLRDGVWLSESTELSSPVALGTREVCLPAQAVEKLDDRALAALLAHELAHLERRDNLWLVVGAVVEAALWLPPLARLVREKMHESAELAADDRAVELTADAIGLARSLAEVASWSLEDDTPELAHAMASPGRTLLGRVQRLLDNDERRPPPWLGRSLGAVALAVVLLAAPAVRTATSAPASPPAAVATAPASVTTAITFAATVPAALPALVTVPPLAVAPATVPNDKPGAPRLPKRPAAVVPVAPAPAVEDFPRRPRLRRLAIPMPPRAGGPGFPIPPLPRGAIHDMVKHALDESRAAMDLAAARREADRLRASGARETERKAAEKRVTDLERQHVEARKTREKHAGEFEREMEDWGKEVGRRSEDFGRQIEHWAESTFGHQAALSDEERARRDEERAKRMQERVQERVKRDEERMKREADRLRREADRLEREAERMARDAARNATERPHPPTPPAPVAPAAPVAPTAPTAPAVPAVPPRR
jgi:beta-lactamase regulating signal transducer with metallopeptidase domain